MPYEAEMFNPDIPATEEDRIKFSFYPSGTSREIYFGSARGNETPLS